MKKNLIFAGCILLAAAVLALVLYTRRAQGGSATVTIAGGETRVLSLAQDGIFTFDESDGARLPVTLEVREGRIRFIDSQCPDHLCENFGWLRYAHDEAICLPAGVVVSVEEEAPRAASASGS